MTKRDYLYYRRLRDDLRRAVLFLSKNPAASTTISSGGGSKSVTFRDLTDLQNQINEIEQKLSAFESALTGQGGFSVSYARWC